jgi:hypothetical protein
MLFYKVLRESLKIPGFLSPNAPYRLCLASALVFLDLRGLGHKAAPAVVVGTLIGEVHNVYDVLGHLAVLPF